MLVSFAIVPTMMGVCELPGQWLLLSKLRKVQKFSPACLLHWEVKSSMLLLSQRLWKDEVRKRGWFRNAAGLG